MRLILSFLLVLLFMGACREEYALPTEKALSSALVVEGSILKGDTTVIKLSRVLAVADNDLHPEVGATISVEGDDNSRYTLSESENGIYKVAPLELNASTKYRLTISAGGQNYESEWTTLINTANIDSLYWERNNGVQIYIKSSGSSDDSRYYKWDYEEVWEFYSLFESHAYYNYIPYTSGHDVIVCDSPEVNGIKYENCIAAYIWRGYVFNDSMYHCWKYDRNTSIAIGSTTALSGNVIQSPIKVIEDNGFELSNLYTILVKQTGLSREAHDFYKLLKANSEGMGSIFDAQPSELKTNIRCISDPGEIVIGFVEASTVKMKRLFISKHEVPDLFYYPYYACAATLDTISDVSPYTTNFMLTTGRVPVSIVEMENEPPHRVSWYTVADETCVDCRLRGVHKKPDFWPQ